MKKRINVTEEAFDKLATIAVDLKIKGAKQNDKVAKLFNEKYLFDKIDSIVNDLSKQKEEIEELQKNKIIINEEQLKRIEKLQAIGILDEDLSEAIKILIDSFVDVKEDTIKELILKI